MRKRVSESWREFRKQNKAQRRDLLPLVPELKRVQKGQGFLPGRQRQGPCLYTEDYFPHGKKNTQQQKNFPRPQEEWAELGKDLEESMNEV